MNLDLIDLNLNKNSTRVANLNATLNLNNFFLALIKPARSEFLG